MRVEKQGPVFVIGMPRSGTTLLSVMLNSHSQLAISPETHYFTKYKHIGDMIINTSDKAVKRKLISQLLQSQEVADMKFSSSEMTDIAESLTHDMELTHAKILGTILRQYAAKQGKERWGEKTPGHYRFVPIIKANFPDAKFISILRDPRDISLSLRKVPWSSNNIFHHAWHWKQYVRLSNRYALQYKEHYLEVKYEDLLSNPTKVVRSICNFLNLPFENQMLAFHEKGALNFDPAREPWKKKAAQPLDPSNMMKWLRAMPPEEVKVAELLASKELKLMGYPVRHDQWNARLMLSVSSIVLNGLGWSLRKKIARRWTAIFSSCKRWVARSRMEEYVKREGG